MPSILIIDDEHDIRVCLREVLECEGYTVFSSANGVDGLAVLGHVQNLVLILLDWNMPLVNGETSMKVKMQDKTFATIPTIVITAAAENILAVGISELLKKPIDLEALTKTVKKYCG